jgi:hypothetical protein
MWGERSLIRKAMAPCTGEVCVLENKHEAEGPPVAVILVNASAGGY